MFDYLTTNISARIAKKVSMYKHFYVSILTAIAIKESAKVGDQAARRSAKGIDDLGKHIYT